MNQNAEIIRALTERLDVDTGHGGIGSSYGLVRGYCAAIGTWAPYTGPLPNLIAVCRLADEELSRREAAGEVLNARERLISIALRESIARASMQHHSDK
jgi:hypothetical protein